MGATETDAEAREAEMDSAPVDGVALRTLRRVLELHRRLVAATSDDRAILPIDAVPGLVAVRDSWTDILAELDGLERAGRDALAFEEVAGMDLGLDGRWTGHFLLEHGQVLPAGRAHCPVTLARVREVRGINSAYFSVMGPGTHLAPHVGPNKSVLRAHVTLRTPEPVGMAALVVDGQRVDHEPGVAFLFDDTFQHEAWNRGDSDRVTLMMELRRPIPWWLRPFDGAVQLLFRFHPVQRSALRRLRELEVARNG